MVVADALSRVGISSKYVIEHNLSGRKVNRGKFSIADIG